MTYCRGTKAGLQEDQMLPDQVIRGGLIGVAQDHPTRVDGQASRCQLLGLQRETAQDRAGSKSRYWRLGGF